jgi:hypothetical protein
MALDNLISVQLSDAELSRLDGAMSEIERIETAVFRGRDIKHPL